MQACRKRVARVRGVCEPFYRVNTAAANTTVSISNDTPATGH